MTIKHLLSHKANFYSLTLMIYQSIDIYVMIKRRFETTLITKTQELTVCLNLSPRPIDHNNYTDQSYTLAIYSLPCANHAAFFNRSVVSFHRWIVIIRPIVMLDQSIDISDKCFVTRSNYFLWWKFSSTKIFIFIFYWSDRSYNPPINRASDETFRHKKTSDVRDKCFLHVSINFN